jgi:large subunit ribosomal protein L16
MKKQGRLILNIFPQTPITKKPLEIRMGKGKGNVDHWVYKVKPGMLLLEIESENVSLAIRAIKLIQIRIPLTTQIVYN